MPQLRTIMRPVSRRWVFSSRFDPICHGGQFWGISLGNALPSCIQVLNFQKWQLRILPAASMRCALMWFVTLCTRKGAACGRTTVVTWSTTFTFVSTNVEPARDISFPSALVRGSHAIHRTLLRFPQGIIALLLLLLLWLPSSLRRRGICHHSSWVINCL